jgi:ATP-dependent Clp protease ATP-binding subunit ClpC
MFERFTDRAKKVMSLASQEAQRLHSEYIGTEHVLLGLVKEGSGVGANVLRNLNADLRAIRTEIEKAAKREVGHTVSMAKLPQTPKAKKVIEYAIEEARNLNHNYIGTEHLLLGLLRERQGKAVQTLEALGIKIGQVRDEVLSLLGDGAAIEEADDGAEGGEVAPPGAAKKKKSSTPALDSYGRDLTEMARDGRLDPVIGRRTEIERVIQILCRRQKNNPVLLGEAGVGKTAIVEGLAQKIVGGDIPQLLAGRRIVCLDLAMMVAGTKYRGQFEERIKTVMAEVRKAKNVILFIDEMHTLIGAGGAEGAIDAANVLKPALSRGEIQCIGATTLTEYRKYIEKDSALERRFQKIMVEPPSREETLEIIKGLRDRYEAHHRVRFPDASVALAVELADRFISGRVQPDKSIDVIDEAGARMRLRTSTKPPEVAGIDGEIGRLTREKREAVENSEFERAAQLRDALDDAVKSRKNAEKGWEASQQTADTFVGEDVIAEVVSGITGVPLTRLSRDEAARLLGLEAELHRSVVSQDEAVSAIAKSVRRSRSGLKDPNRPMGSFIFVGPSGVGKTYLAKRLAEFMFGDPDALLALDMSEYMEKHNVSRLIGAPPGYVGYEEGGQLTEFVRRRPYSIVLFDEVEKAHPDTFNMLLQIMEEGRLTDSFGRHVDFKNTIVIMTSNVGAHKITHQDDFGFGKRDANVSYDKMKETLKAELENTLRPEFLNRLDEVIVFRKLTHDDLVRIVDLEVSKVGLRLRGKGLSLELTQGAKDFLVEKGTDEKFGARPLRRAIGAHLEDGLSEAILRGDFAGKAKVLASVAGDGDGRKLTLVGQD